MVLQMPQKLIRTSETKTTIFFKAHVYVYEKK